MYLLKIFTKKHVLHILGLLPLLRAMDFLADDDGWRDSRHRVFGGFTEERQLLCFDALSVVEADTIARPRNVVFDSAF